MYQANHYRLIKRPQPRHDALSG